MIIATAKKYLKDIKTDSLYGPVHKKYSEFSMVTRRDYIDCLKLVSKFKDVNGSVIECGVWRGGMIAGIAEVLGNNRNYYLFDSFEGLPETWNYFMSKEILDVGGALPEIRDEPIAILRLDGDWYDSTMVCLEHLFPKVIPGGLIILDDYYAWDGCSKALHDYLSKYKRAERIIQAYSSGCYLIKKA